MRVRVTEGLVAMVAVALLMTACSPEEPAVETTTTAAPTTTTATTLPTTTTTTIPRDPRLDEHIPVDDAVQIGTLANGLRYYIRENDSPGSSAELRLLVNAGSLKEDDDQSGNAHYLEHMLFNGTERFPVNELTAVLESFGARFGPDVNAYTSFDETVYELGLPLIDPELLPLAFDVLLEWSSRATIEKSDVDAERGVVIEEWRLRDQGVAGRIGDVFEELVLAGTPYEGRSPIGIIDSLRATDEERLRRFYEDWYQPRNMAIVAVGDFEADEVKRLIEDRFAGLEGTARAHRDPGISPGGGTEYATFIDSELRSAFVEAVFSQPSTPAVTVGDLRDRLAAVLAFEIIATRLEDDITRADAPFFSVQSFQFPIVRALDLVGLAVDTNPADAATAADALFAEIERVRRHGFTEAELARVVTEVRSLTEQALAGVETMQDWQFAEAYLRHFLAGAPIPSAQDEFDLTMEALDVFTVNHIYDAFLAVVDSSRLSVLAAGPDDRLPNEAELEGLYETVLAGTIEPRDLQGTVLEALMERPDDLAPVVSRGGVSVLDIEIIEFANGARVAILRTGIAENRVLFAAASSGGTSVVSEEDVVEAQLGPEIVSQSGVGDFDQVALDRFLAGSVVSVAPFIEETSEGMFGSAASEDLETMFQLIHLYLTVPRADASAVQSVLTSYRPLSASPESVPDVASFVALLDARYGETGRYALNPTADELDTFDVARALEIYEDRFGDVGDFLFVFVGDLDPQVVETLSQAYLGTLPGTNREDPWADNQPPPPAGIVRRSIDVGQGNQGFVTLLSTGELATDSEDRIHLDLLELIVRIRLRDRLREALSATYSPIVAIDSYDRPDEIVETLIQISGDPLRLEEILSETTAALQDLATNGPTDAELATAREQLVRQFEFVSDEFWLDTITFYADRPAESITEILFRIDVATATTVTDIQQLAAIIFPSDQYIEVLQRPA